LLGKNQLFYGVEWGFDLYFTKLRPIAIKPRLLNKEESNQDWKYLKETLLEYIVLLDNI
jgi:hypothetical protein